MGDVINLRRVRKRMKRTEEELNAASQRMKFGRTSAERANDAVDATRTDKKLSGHFLEREDEK